jgi:hypothetical protein
MQGGVESEEAGGQDPELNLNLNVNLNQPQTQPCF